MSSPGDERYRTHNSGPSKREAEQGLALLGYLVSGPPDAPAAPGSQQKKPKSSSKADKIPTKGMQVYAFTEFLNRPLDALQQAMTAFFKPTAKA